MKKRSSLLLLSVIGVSMLLAGCNPGGDDGGNGGNKEPGDTYSLMKFWAGNASEEIYSVEENETEMAVGNLLLDHLHMILFILIILINMKN